MQRNVPLDRMDDWQLLEHYRRENSHDAFGQLFKRHERMVMRRAFATVRDRQLAEDVTQTVFMLLSRKAPALKPQTVIAGWLCNAARLTSRTALRGVNRRSFHERAAWVHRGIHCAVPAGDDPGESLETALRRLPENDRQALRLRWWKELPLREVGRQMNVSERAAEKRVSRAVARLREQFFAGVA
jgi:DNA-directed RNA polymerase specialized sigma24 family protein